MSPFFVVTVYAMSPSFVVLFKVIFHSNSKRSSSPPACSQGQTAVSLHRDTWVIQGQPLDGTAKARVLRLVHRIHAWGTDKQKTECTSQLTLDSFHLESTECTYCTSCCRAFMFDGMSNAAGIFTAAVHVCDKSLCYYAECYSQFQISLQYEVWVGCLSLVS